MKIIFTTALFALLLFACNNNTQEITVSLQKLQFTPAKQPLIEIGF